MRLPGQPRWRFPDPSSAGPDGLVGVGADLEPATLVDACADRPGDPTWITGAMRAAYRRLHDLGHAHSLEVWAGGELVGGLYGVAVGGVFTGESMFHRAPDASKAALADLADRMLEAGGRLIDVQVVTPHLRSLGAREIPRAEFLALLGRVRDERVTLATDRRRIARLAGG